MERTGTASSASPASTSSAKAVTATGKSASEARQQIAVTSVLKVMFFAILMACLPICTYFYSSRRIFNETEYATTYAALSAAGIANVVAFGYVLMAVMEDQPAKEKKKGQ